MEHRFELVVRSYECDSYGHVNNAVYLNYLECARHEFLRAIGLDLPRLRALGHGLVVARIDIQYHRPATEGERLTVASRPTRRMRIGGVMGQRLLRGEQLVAEAEVTWVSIGPHGRLAPLPSGFDVPGLLPDGAAA